MRSLTSRNRISFWASRSLREAIVQSMPATRSVQSSAHCAPGENPTSGASVSCLDRLWRKIAGRCSYNSRIGAGSSSRPFSPLKRRRSTERVTLPRLHPWRLLPRPQPERLGHEWAAAGTRGVRAAGRSTRDGELGAWDRDGHPDFHRLGGAGIEPGPAPRSGYALAGKSWSLPVHADAVDGPPT